MHWCDRVGAIHKTLSSPPQAIAAAAADDGDNDYVCGTMFKSSCVFINGLIDWTLSCRGQVI